MKAISRIALGISLALVGGNLAVAPAMAKKAAEEEQKFNLSPDVAKNLSEAQKLIAAKDYANAAPKISAAEAAIKNDDDRFQVGAFKLNLGTVTNNPALQGEGIDLAVASGKGTTAQRKELLHNQGAIALGAKNPAKAEVAFTQLVALDPKDTANVLTLAQLKARNGKGAEAMTTVNQAITAQKASGKPVPEDRSHGLRSPMTRTARMGTENGARSLVASYPSPTNWRDSPTGLSHAQQARFRRQSRRDAPASRGPRSEGRIGLLRICQHGDGPRPARRSEVGGRGGQRRRGNQRFAASLPGRAGPLRLKDRAGQGVAAPARSSGQDGAEWQARGEHRGRLSRLRQYAQAAALYRVALQKGGVDVAAVNTPPSGLRSPCRATRLVRSRPSARSAGPRAAIAKYWTIWLGQPG